MAKSNYIGSIQYLEHVVVTMTVVALNGSDCSRGDIQIELTSPAGTLSKLLGERNDSGPGGYYNWPFMSVMFWGENPTGDWNLTVYTMYCCNYSIYVGDINITFYGVDTVSESVANIPEECDANCKRGCAQDGYCDACVNLRNAYTLECTDECPPGYTERNGYCYNESITSEECVSPLKDKDPYTGYFIYRTIQ